MKEMKYTGAVALLMVAGAIHADVVGSDNFDGTSTYASRTITSGINNANNTFSIVSRANVNNASMIDTSVAAGGKIAFNAADTLGFLGTNNTDNVFGMYRAGAARTLVYTFTISNYTNLNVAMDWAISGDIADKNTSMSYSIDGAAATTVFDIGTSGVNWNETMDNGTVLNRNRNASVLVNGVSAAHLTDEFQTYNPTIAGAGSVLTLTFVQDNTVGGYGGIGLDNIILNGTVIPEPATLGMVAAFGGGILFIRRRLQM